MHYSEKARNAFRQIIAKSIKETRKVEVNPSEVVEAYTIMSVFIQTHGLKKKYLDFVRAVQTD